MDHTIPKQFILEINSEENFTQGAGALSFVFNLLQPKASFPTSARVSATLGSEQLRAEPPTRAAPRGPPFSHVPGSAIPESPITSSAALKTWELALWVPLRLQACPPSLPSWSLHLAPSYPLRPPAPAASAPSPCWQLSAGTATFRPSPCPELGQWLHSPGQFRRPLGSWFWSQAAAGSLCGLRQVAAPLCAD